MTALELQRTINAFNTAHASENKIHDNETARRFGFAGGLVPGVDVFAYMTHPAVAHWGRDWLERGRLSARFTKPVYDGQDVSVTGSGTAPMAVSVRHGQTVCAAGEASMGDAVAGDTDIDIPQAAQPPERPPASSESLASGTVLGTLLARCDAEEIGAYANDVREDLALYREDGLVHPGWLLRRANRVLAANVVLGPWIHVASDMRFLGLARLGDALEVRARSLDCYERKGHKIVDLDVLILTGGRRPVARIRHSAIYAPRQVTQAG